MIFWTSALNFLCLASPIRFSSMANKHYLWFAMCKMPLLYLANAQKLHFAMHNSPLFYLANAQKLHFAMYTMFKIYLANMFFSKIPCMNIK